MKPVARIIAVGNALRGDDAAGVALGKVLRARAIEGADVVDATGEGTELMDAWGDADFVVIVDACRSGSTPGAVLRLDARENEIPSALFHYSTHAFGVAEAVELSRVLGQLPTRLIIYGIEGACFAAGRPLSPEVESAVLEVADLIESDIYRLEGV